MKQNKQKALERLREIEDINVKYLINKLLDCKMDDKIVIRDKDGKRITPVHINIKEDEGLSCLFG